MRSKNFIIKILLACLVLLLLIPSQAPADIASNLVGYWTLNENSGSTANDTSGSGCTGTLVNTPTWTAPGKIGAANLSFAASSSEYVDLGTCSALAVTGNLTLAAWVKVTSWPTPGEVFYSIIDRGYNGGTNTQLYSLRMESDTDTSITYLDFVTFNGSNHGVHHLYDVQGPQSTGVWFHVMGVFNGSTWKVYVNNSEVASSTDSTTPATGGSRKFFIGGEDVDGTPGRFCDCQLDDVRIYSRALSSDDRAELFAFTGGRRAAPIIFW